VTANQIPHLFCRFRFRAQSIANREDRHIQQVAESLDSHLMQRTATLNGKGQVNNRNGPHFFWRRGLRQTIVRPGVSWIWPVFDDSRTAHGTVPIRRCEQCLGHKRHTTRDGKSKIFSTSRTRVLNVVFH